MEEFNRRVKYCPLTGICFYRITVHSQAKKGQILKSINTGGYLKVSIYSQSFYLHRLLYKLHFPHWKEKTEIDHINGNPLDNRIENLREVTHLENGRNQKRVPSNTSGHSGVYWNKTRQKWQAYIYLKKKQHHLGLFLTKKEAIEARLRAETTHNFHQNHGTR